MFKKLLTIGLVVGVGYLAWTSGSIQAKEKNPNPTSFNVAPASQSFVVVQDSADSVVGTASSSSETPSPVPLATLAPPPSPSPSLTPSPTPKTPAKQVALGFIDLFQKKDPPAGSGNGMLGLNFVSANGQGSVYAEGGETSVAARRSLYGIVFALGLLGISTIMYGRSKYTV